MPVNHLQSHVLPETLLHMTKVLITAFEPYQPWEANSSWLTVVELTKDLPAQPEITTRLYPVDFDQIEKKLRADLTDNFDYLLHLGQAPGSGGVELERVAINVRLAPGEPEDQAQPLVADGPAAYMSKLPLADWAAKLRGEGIPAAVSYHAGTFLCNAALYYSHHIIAQEGLKTQATFVHLPLDITQSATTTKDIASLPAAISAQAVRGILGELSNAVA